MDISFTYVGSRFKKQPGPSQLGAPYSELTLSGNFGIVFLQTTEKTDSYGVRFDEFSGIFFDQQGKADITGKRTRDFIVFDRKYAYGQNFIHMAATCPEPLQLDRTVFHDGETYRGVWSGATEGVFEMQVPTKIAEILKLELETYMRTFSPDVRKE